MIVPAPILIDPSNPHLEQQIEVLPSGSGVYAIRMRSAAPHLSSCAYLRARVRRLLGDSLAVSKQRLREQVVGIDCWPTASRLETWLLLLGLAQRWSPDDYERKLRLRRPWFVALSADRFPRLSVMNKLPDENGQIYGPFPSRDAAAAYAEAAAGLFQVRKCPDPLHPAPDHPGCIYGEMHQCMRPCQLAVSDEEYASEAARVEEFLRTNGTATRSSLLMARERACEELDFELAAQLHKRLERLATASALRDDPATSLTGFGGLAVTPSLHAAAVRLWPMRNAIWLPPLDIDLSSDTTHSRSLDATLRETVAASFQAHSRFGALCANSSEDAAETNEDRSAHLAILLRWYRSSYRDGEWLPDVPGKGISYRKLVGAISRLLKN